MQFASIIVAAFLSASAMATPANLAKRNPPTPLCEGLEASPQCCAVNALGVADLDCAPPATLPENIPAFIKACAAIGQEAQCCVLPVLGQALVCQAPPA